MAAEYGHLTVVEVLLHRKSHIDAQNAKGLTALMFSARNGHSAVVQLLCGLAALNLQDAKGRMALHHAAQRGHEDVASCLLKASAQVDSLDASGRTPLHLSTLGRSETKQHLCSKQPVLHDDRSLSSFVFFVILGYNYIL